MNTNKNKFNTFFICKGIKTSKNNQDVKIAQKNNSFFMKTCKIQQLISSQRQQINKKQTNELFQPKLKLNNVKIYEDTQFNMINYSKIQTQPYNNNNARQNIIQCLKNNMLDIPLKYKRFSSILKNKYQKQHKQQEFKKSSPLKFNILLEKSQRNFMTQKQLKTSKKTSRNSSSFSRPSSSKPLVEGNRYYLKKKRYSTFQENQKSLDFKHIDVLQFFNPTSELKQRKNSRIIQKKKKNLTIETQSANEQVKGWQNKNLQQVQIQIGFFFHKK